MLVFSSRHYETCTLNVTHWIALVICNVAMLHVLLLHSQKLSVLCTDFGAIAVTYARSCTVTIRCAW